MPPGGCGSPRNSLGLANVKFDFVAPRIVRFGAGRRREAGQIAARIGHRAFLIVGSRTLEKSPLLGDIRDSLAGANVEIVSCGTTSHEPLLDDLQALTDTLKAHQAGQGDLMLAVGGGAAIDLAKAAGALATQTVDAPAIDYLEGVGRGLTIFAPPLPLLAIPTTGGTGAEATKNAVISSRVPPFKKSLRHESMMASAVLIDPELHVSLPAKWTAYCGMDAITQLIESYVSRFSQPLPRALCLQGLRRAIPALARAMQDGGDIEARGDMAYAAFLSGLALANSGLGMAHGVAAALGVIADVPHGLACAVMLPAAIEANLPTCEQGFAELARVALGDSSRDDHHMSRRLLETIQELSRAIGIPTRLSQIGVRHDQIPALVKNSGGNSMNGNPRGLAEQELTELLEKML